MGGSGDYSSVLARIATLKESHPNNLAVKNFDVEYFNSLSDEDKPKLLQIAQSGIDNEDSGVGAYAMNPTDYEKFKPYLDKVIREYHKVPAGQNHVNDWALEGVEGLPEDGKLDLTKL